MKYDLRQELEKLRLGCEDLREDLWTPPTKEKNSFSAADIELVGQTIDDANDATDEAEGINDILVATEAMLTSGIKPSLLEQTALRLTILQLRGNGKDQLYLGTESFGTDLLNLAVEDLKTKFTAAKDKVIEIVRTIWEKVISFLKTFFDRNKKLIKKVQSLITSLEKNELKGKVTLQPENGATNITLKGKLGRESIKQVLDNVTNLFDTQTKELANVISSNYPVDSSKFKELLTDAFMSLGSETGKSFDTLDVSRIIAINDAWIFKLVLLEASEPPLKNLSLPALLRGTTQVESQPAGTISGPEIIELLKNIISILEINASDDSRAADAVLRKIKKDKQLDEDFSKALSMVGRYVFRRSELRYNVCVDYVKLFERSMNKSVGGEDDTE